jgi:hypothetical protein
VGGQLHALAALPQWKDTWYTLERELGGLQGWFRHYEKEKLFLSLTGIEIRFFGCPATNLVTIMTELSRLIFCSF